MRFLFGSHVLDIDRRELRLGAEPVALEPLVFDLLVYLVANRDRVVSRDDVLDTVWSGRIVSESALTTRIAAARRALGDSGVAQTLIRTIARKGFRFVGEVLEEKSAAAVPPETPLQFTTVTSPFSRPDKPSIAVLAFANIGRNPEHEYFVDGISDDIITDLSHDRSLFVISRSSSFTYKDRAIEDRKSVV